MGNPSKFKLGRKAIKKDSRTLRLEDYLTPALPVAPASVDWSKGITNWGMMLNDSIGDCTVAGIGHACQVWTANVGTEVTPTDAEVLRAYEVWCGYNPNDPSTDQGGICLDVLSDFKNMGFFNNKLTAFAAVDTWKRQAIKQCIYLFGGCYIGLNVPNYVMDNPDPSIVWENSLSNRDIAGGHCVFCIGYESNIISFISWGSIYRMTEAFWRNFVDEAYGMISPDWIGTTGAPNGFNLAQLEADVAAIR